jgi:hypothetical protein
MLMEKEKIFQIVQAWREYDRVIRHIAHVKTLLESDEPSVDTLAEFLYRDHEIRHWEKTDALKRRVKEYIKELVLPELEEREKMATEALELL